MSSIRPADSGGEELCTVSDANVATCGQPDVVTGAGKDGGATRQRMSLSLSPILVSVSFSDTAVVLPSTTRPVLGSHSDDTVVAARIWSSTWSMVP